MAVLPDEPCYQFDMRRVAKLIDRRDDFDLVAALDQNFASRANVATLQDTETTAGTLLARAVSPAPARPGVADRTRPRRNRAAPAHQRRRNSRASRLHRFQSRGRGRAFCNAVTAPASLSNAVILAFAANRSANGRPAKEISDVLGALAAAATNAASVSSPATVA